VLGFGLDRAYALRIPVGRAGDRADVPADGVTVLDQSWAGHDTITDAI
jgi:hypothetical protein